MRTANGQWARIVVSGRADQFRQFYAEFVTAGLGAAQSALRSAFAVVPREHFLGPGPWKIYAGPGYVETPSSHVAFVYQDVVIALSPAKGLNNGQPSLHARCLGALGPCGGQDALHIGAGTGYYTALLAELVGPTGRVQALELDRRLAEAARNNLSGRPNVHVRSRSGVIGPLPMQDIIYVSAAATAPLRVWIDALRPRGRLIFPLTPGDGHGAMLRVTRTQDGLAAEFLCTAQFVPCIGAQNSLERQRLRRAFAAGGAHDVRQLYFDRRPDATAWMAGKGWWLSNRPLA